MSHPHPSSHALDDELLSPLTRISRAPSPVPSIPPPAYTPRTNSEIPPVPSIPSIPNSYPREPTYKSPPSPTPSIQDPYYPTYPTSQFRAMNASSSSSSSSLDEIEGKIATARERRCSGTALIVMGFCVGGVVVAGVVVGAWFGSLRWRGN
ncbi:uncharacterized protein LY89DRAFT_778181 [Mollisia scopiformis]|uniref:Uncharacterized protein n=1 Tax=Mollisia scopiformis TaxID=149040 RepID=A0A194XPY5_MOLSC|nr:uncharacterized protein LY89DRAFT_778181 [Mollisia scopiformis]KUJ21807.1 hypothetical protein LY89DRAFT_778181 [Mollisia scopiformis]